MILCTGCDKFGLASRSMPAVQRACGEGVPDNGTTAAIRPQTPATRAEVAVAICVFLKDMLEQRSCDILYKSHSRSGNNETCRKAPGIGSKGKCHGIPTVGSHR